MVTEVNLIWESDEKESSDDDSSKRKKYPISSV